MANAFVGNSVAGVQNSTESIIIDATDNWWGSNSGPYDPTEEVSGPPDYNPFGNGDTVGDYVHYRPWIKEKLLRKT